MKQENGPMTPAQPPPDPDWWLVPSVLVAALVYGLAAWGVVNALRTW